MPHPSIDWLYGLQHFGIKLGLENIRALLGILGHPERDLAVIHVAGTNGKGSVAAMADAMLGAAGLSTGLFTSPHLVRPTERIRIDGGDLEADELHQRLEAMRGTIDDARQRGELEAHPSFFEVMTATALLAFRDHGVQAAILEVGLGGRLDATNVVEADVGVIVSIGFDHTKTLGDTLEAIAGEKAGIVKTGMPVVSGVVQQRAVEVVRQVCDERQARFIDARTAVELRDRDGERFTLRSGTGVHADLEPALPGSHQIDNARVAVAAVEELATRRGFALPPDCVRRGLASVRWPGRLQWLEPADGPPRLLFDGAHNPPGIQAVARFLAGREWARPVLLFGATRGKSLDELLAPLAKFADEIVIGRPPVERGLDPAEVAEVARNYFERVETAHGPREALARARILAGPERWVLVTGSLYLVGDVLGTLDDDPVPGPVAL